MALRFTSHSRSSATFKRGITGFRTPQARWTIVGSACIKSGLIKGIHLGTAHRNKSGVLFDAVGAKPIDPKDRILMSVPDAIFPIFGWHLYNTRQTRPNSARWGRSG